MHRLYIIKNIPCILKIAFDGEAPSPVTLTASPAWPIFSPRELLCLLACNYCYVCDL